MESTPKLGRCPASPLNPLSQHDFGGRGPESGLGTPGTEVEGDGPQEEVPSHTAKIPAIGTGPLIDRREDHGTAAAGFQNSLHQDDIALDRMASHDNLTDGRATGSKGRRVDENLIAGRESGSHALSLDPETPSTAQNPERDLVDGVH